MNCREFQDGLQDWLDGASEPSALREHARACDVCRPDYAAARALSRGLAALPRPTLTPAAVAQLTSTVARERRARRWRVAAASFAGVAAAVLVTVLTLRPGPAVPVVPAPASPKHVEIAARAETAQKAVVDLSRSVAAKTKSHVGVILAAATPDAPAPIALVPEFDDPIEPAAESLKQAGRTVAHSLEPMAQSAYQAVAFFARELGR